MTDHKELNQWIDQMAAMCEPDKIVLINGSEEEKKQLEDECVASGELIRLNPEKRPGCFYHRTAENDVARVEHLTFICSEKEEDAGPTNNWMAPDEAYKKAGEYFKGAMKGRAMYVIPFSMGPVGSPLSKIGVQLTDSRYVVLNMRIMTRVGSKVLDVLGQNGEFTKCLHSKADLDVKKRLILHFPQDNVIWSVGSGYGGNVLLGKKCLALRIGSKLAKDEGWMAEHMLILGIESPDGKTEYVAAAFPSACGKTNLAMLVPPEGLKVKGYKVWTVGDDIAWMHVNDKGELRAINPENGYFGVAPGTNSHSNPTAVKTVQKNTIFTNVLLADDEDVWWEDGDGVPPTKGTDWRGNPWTPEAKDADGNPVRGAHPNSRFTAPCQQCPSLSDRFEDMDGVPISAIIFGGRREKLAPLVYEAFSWEHGVYVGATMSSERTAAQVGKQGEVRFDPMAMLPFCGYNMADYFQHWLDMGSKIKNPPKIFHVDWFRKDDEGQFIWPGYGDNLRVLEWILARSNNKGDAIKTLIGYVPTNNAIDFTGLDIDDDKANQLFSISIEDWKREIILREEHLAKFGNKLPSVLKKEQSNLKERLESFTGENAE